MTKKEMMHLATRYGMELCRNPITREATAYTVESPELIPELDQYADNTEPNPVAVERTLAADAYTYTVYIPRGWIDLYGE